MSLPHRSHPNDDMVSNWEFIKDMKMSTCVFDKDLYRSDDERERLITALREALNAAESGLDEVTINNCGMEITWNFTDGEFFVNA